MILVAGPPGAGKTLQAKKLAEKYDVIWMSMGQLLRDTVDEEVKEIMNQGKLLDDDMVQSVLAEAINQVGPETIILLDGFPRRESQVEWFLGHIQQVKRELKGALHIIIDLETSIERLEARGRMDDEASIITRRYKQYQSEIVPMLHHLQHVGVKIHNIDGNQSIDDVHGQIVSAIGDTLK